MGLRIALLRTGGMLAVLLSAALYSSPQQVPAPTPAERPPDPEKLVRTVVYNELNSPDTGQFLAWKQHQVKPNRITVKQYVDTPQGLLGRVLTLNGKPLTGDALAKENARINRLLDPKQMQEKRKQQKEDENRTRKLVAALPDAFLYRVTGTEVKNGHTLINLHFTPNPDFRSPSRETLVFQGMEGEMVIDNTEMRLVKIDGTMMKDVSIGWGIIGHLDKGGRFEVQQSEVEKGDWEIVYMRLNFTGRALIFKTIRINEIDTSYDFRRVPKMSVAEGIDYLKKANAENGTVAEKGK